MSEAVGIDAIAVHVPRLYVDLTGEWAEVRAAQLGEASPEKLRGKVIRGVGVQKMAVPDGHEDAATLAAMAAKRVIDGAGIDPRDIGSIAVGTETTVDQSKSMAAYVLGMLEAHYGVSLAHVGCPQYQFACIGATYALEAAAHQLLAGENTRRYALVIATDISRYKLRSPGEYTQGAGAAAMLVAERPRLLALEPRAVGTASRDERDFFRPNWSPTAVVDGKYSIDVYLDLMDAAFAQYEGRMRERLARRGALHEAIDHALFHVPFPRMAEYAAARVFRRLLAGDPAAGRLEATAATPEARREQDRALAAAPAFQHAYAAKTEPSLTYAREIGNIYSGSLYLALATLLERARDAGQALEGQRVALCSYGSGASAKVFSGVVADGWRDATRALALGPQLAARRAISLAEYERLHARADARTVVPADLLARLRDGAALSAEDRAQIVERLEHPEMEPGEPVASLETPRGEFALVGFGRSETPGKTDTGYRYYEFRP